MTKNRPDSAVPWANQPEVETQVNSHELIPGAIGDLIAFAQPADLPALPQIALGRAQFETIYPFADGNGRTGRALVQALLRNKGLTR